MKERERGKIYIRSQSSSFSVVVIEQNTPLLLEVCIQEREREKCIAHAFNLCALTTLVVLREEEKNLTFDIHSNHDFNECFTWTLKLRKGRKKPKKRRVWDIVILVIQNVKVRIVH